MVLELLSTRALNRALLARQMLLERVKLPAVQIIEHLGGLQAQQARPAFTGLWSRVDGFRRGDLLDFLRNGDVVRATTLRGTLHLTSRADYEAFRPLLQPMLTAGCQSILRERFTSLDHEAIRDRALAFFKKGPRTFTELRNELMGAFPEGDERAMGYFIRMHLPLTSVPEEQSPWCFGPDTAFGLASEGKDARIEALITRYLGAFGPATPADFQAWCGLKGAKAWFESMELATFRDSRKRVLYDLPDAPRPDEDTPAPVRLIAEFDNLVLGHADRSRIVADEYRPRIVTKNLLVLGTFLVDGFVAGTWKFDGKKVAVEPFESLAPKVKKTLDVEAAQLAGFLS